MRKVADMDLLPVAQIVKSYDVNGEVMIRMTSGILDDYNFKKEPVFIYFDGLPVPFFISGGGCLRPIHQRAAILGKGTRNRGRFPLHARYDPARGLSFGK